MTITAFGIGMEAQLGTFNAGWWGIPVDAVLTRWRVNVATGTKPGWAPVPVVKTQWEER